MGWLNDTTAFSQLSGSLALSQIAAGSATGAGLRWNGTAWTNAALTPQGIVDEANPAGTYEVIGGRTIQNGNIAVLTSGVMSVCPVWLPAGAVVTSIVVRSATTPLSAGTHWWFALYSNYTDATGANSLLLAQTADQGAGAWAANTPQNIALTAPQTIASDGWYGIGVMVAATVPTLRGETIGNAVFSAGDIAGQVDLAKTVGAALAATAPANLNGFASSANMFYAAVH